MFIDDHNLGCATNRFNHLKSWSKKLISPTQVKKLEAQGIIGVELFIFTLVFLPICLLWDKVVKLDGVPFPLNLLFKRRIKKTKSVYDKVNDFRSAQKRKSQIELGVSSLVGIREKGVENNKKIKNNQNIKNNKKLKRVETLKQKESKKGNKLIEVNRVPIGPFIEVSRSRSKRSQKKGEKMSVSTSFAIPVEGRVVSYKIDRSVWIPKNENITTQSMLEDVAKKNIQAVNTFVAEKVTKLAVQAKVTLQRTLKMRFARLQKRAFKLCGLIEKAVEKSGKDLLIRKYLGVVFTNLDFFGDNTIVKGWFSILDNKLVCRMPLQKSFVIEPEHLISNLREVTDYHLLAQLLANLIKCGLLPQTRSYLIGVQNVQKVLQGVTKQPDSHRVCYQKALKAVGLPYTDSVARFLGYAKYLLRGFQ